MNQFFILGDETIIGKLESSLHDGLDDIKKLDLDGTKTKHGKKSKMEVDEERRFPPTSYEQLWQSDEELDRAELEELVHDNVCFSDVFLRVFISKHELGNALF